MAGTLVKRGTYRASNGVSWGRWLGGLPAVALVAAMMAWALQLAYALGCRAGLGPVMLILVLMWPLAGAMYVFIDWAHCRNRLLASGAALLAGLVAFCGQYAIGAVADEGWQAACRLDLLPARIAERSRTDAAAAAAEGDQPRTLTEIDESARSHLFFTGILGLLFVVMPVMTAWQRAGHAYSEMGRCWMKRVKATLPAGAGTALVELFESGGYELARQIRGMELTALDSRCEAVLEFCEADGRASAELPGYVTLTEYDVRQRIGGNRTNSSLVVRQMELSPDEVAALAGLFPAVAGAARAPAVAAV
jgi:hypothetical protein